MNAAVVVRQGLLRSRRRFLPTVRPVCRLVEVAPLLNVGLLLLLLQIAHSPYVLQPGIRVNLPAAQFTEGSPYGSVVVALSQEGLVFCDDQRTTLEGLAARFYQAVHARTNATVLIEADERVPHGTMVRVYNMALAAGVHRVTLATRLPPSGGEGAEP